MPEPNTICFGPTGTIAGRRQGLEVLEACFTQSPNPLGAAGRFFGGEVARQTNDTFDTDARAGWAEVGYSFPEAKWPPTISCGVAYFSGDDPATSTFERRDPLLSGGAGEQWRQGANHFKVFQDSNIIAQRFQARLKVAPKVELVPQFWQFKADQLNNISGNLALSVLSDVDLGCEFNVTATYFRSRNVCIYGHLAHRRP